MYNEKNDNLSFMTESMRRINQISSTRQMAQVLNDIEIRRLRE